MDYIYYDPDPGKNHNNDCVKRSLCYVTGKKYLQIQKELNYVKWDLQAQGRVGLDATYRDPVVCTVYANQQGWEHAFYPCPKITVEEFANTHPHGTYVVSTIGHWTACEDGMIHDTFDPGDRIVVETWKVR